MFSEAQLDDKQNKIINSIKRYLKEGEKDKNTLNQSLDNKNFSTALRQACVGKNSKAIEILLDNHAELSINLEETSKNEM